MILDTGKYATLQLIFDRQWDGILHMEGNVRWASWCLHFSH